MASLESWRKAFLNEIEIPPHCRMAGLDPGSVEMAGLLADTQPRIPAEFAGAVPSDPAVTKWLTRLVTDSYAVPQRVPGRLPQVAAGRSLAIDGPTGAGKTHEALGCVRALAALGISARWRFTTAVDLYARMRPRAGIDPEAVFMEHAGAGLLIVDDLGAPKPSDWVEEVTTRLIDHRYAWKLPTIITTNVTGTAAGTGGGTRAGGTRAGGGGGGAPEMKDRIGDRAASRLSGMCDRATLKIPDRRRHRG